MKTMIDVINLCKSYGKNNVLINANLKIGDGNIFGLVGINGAGKSTLLRLLSGVMQADSGQILINGEEVYENENIKKDIFFLPDDPYYTTNLTGNQQAMFYKNFYEFDDNIFKSYIEKFSLNPNKPIRNFSKGMKRQIFISLALACRPKYLFLDEAFDGLDPLARLEFKRGLIELQEQGTSVVIASHSLRELEDICDSFALLDGHVVKAYGKIDNELSKLNKYQLVFATNIEQKDLPFECIHFEKTGRVIKVVVRGDSEEVRTKIAAMKPLIVDEIPMDFEDLFIYEVGERGYIK
ncbi:MAG: ABC transporter ATP-binding protein [Erysipelotrichales bacterium]|nr:ABC transporter ATP-binding protein [Erysipelotrichales bacterium]